MLNAKCLHLLKGGGFFVCCQEDVTAKSLSTVGRPSGKPPDPQKGEGECKMQNAKWGNES